MLKPLLAPYVLLVLLTSSPQQQANTAQQPATTAQPATTTPQPATTAPQAASTAQPATTAPQPANTPPQAANAGSHLGIPVDAAQMVNPVKSTAASLAHAKKIYGYDCAICHGEAGNGKGDLVADLKLTMKDYTNPATLKDYSDGELFYLIRHGRDKMPGEEEARAKPDDVWNLVILLRSFGKS